MNFLTYYKNPEILIPLVTLTIFTTFVASDISKQCPIHHTGRDVCSTVSKGKVTYVGSPTCFFQNADVPQGGALAVF